jgi:putative Mn2+ efflux pump MntP
MASALAFALLCGRGGRLLLEALRPLEEERIPPSRGAVLACAAFFAFAAGFALPFFDVLWAGAGVSMGAGVFLAAALPPLPSSRQRIHRWACAAGGLCLTGVGVKILLDALL